MIVMDAEETVPRRLKPRPFKDKGKDKGKGKGKGKGKNKGRGKNQRRGQSKGKGEEKIRPGNLLAVAVGSLRGAVVGGVETDQL
jgi:hypothetical protein